MLNASRIEELKEEVGEEDFLEVVGLFCEEVEDVLNDLSAASGADLAQKLHFLKGSAFNIGLDAVGEQCRAAEAQLQKDAAAATDIDAIRRTYFESKSKLLA